MANSIPHSDATFNTWQANFFTYFDTNSGKTVHIIGRWVNTKGEPGPICETVSATMHG